MHDWLFGKKRKNPIGCYLLAEQINCSKRNKGGGGEGNVLPPGRTVTSQTDRKKVTHNIIQ